MIISNLTSKDIYYRNPKKPDDLIVFGATHSETDHYEISPRLIDYVDPEMENSQIEVGTEVIDLIVPKPVHGVLFLAPRKLCVIMSGNGRRTDFVYPAWGKKELIPFKKPGIRTSQIEVTVYTKILRVMQNMVNED